MEEEKVEQVETPAEETFYTWNGRTFKTQGELTAFMDALALSQGRNAQKRAELEQELAPYRKLGAKVEIPEEAQLAKQVVALMEEGRHEDAIKLQFDYASKLRQSYSQAEQEKEFWSSYVANRKEIFEHLPEDMARDYVFKNYRDKLYQEEDAFSFIDRVLMPKVAKHVKKDNQEVVPSTLPKGRAQEEPTKKSPEPSASMASTLDKLGFR